MSESRTLKKPAMTGDPMLHCLHMLLGEAPDKTATLALLRDVRFVYVAESLCGRISSMESGQSDRARCLIDGIIDDDIKRLLASPALCEIVRCNLPDSTLLSLLERATDDEAADGWSPLGDVWRGANPPSDIGCHAPDGDNWRGPTLSSNLPIDNSLPASPIRPHGGLRAPRYLDIDETTAAIANVEAALDLLRTNYPFGAALFDGLVTNLVIRSDPVRGIEMWGASSGLAMGRVLLVNVHASTSQEMLAEILLHEAVHCALDCAELRRPMFSLTAVAAGDDIASPWTGNPLSSHALVHASIVWAVLWEFWRRLEPTPQSTTRLSYIAAGFQNLGTSRLQSGCRHTLSEAGFDALRIAQRYVSTADSIAE